LLPSKEKLEEIVRELAKIMRIQDWDISLDYISQYEMKHIFNSDNLDTAMMCERHRLRKEAVIHVNEDHTGIDKHWEESIVHELYHIVVADISDMADDLMDELDSSSIVRRQKMQFVETTVVNLARIFTSVYSVKDLMKEDDLSNGNVSKETCSN
jgi:hypothetical protein